MRTPPLQRRSIRNIQTANINIKHDNNTHPSTTINSVYESHYVFLSSPSPSWGWSSVELEDCSCRGACRLTIITRVVWAAVNTLEPNDVERHTALLLHTHTHTARLTNYTCCMSRSEHTWAQRCGTAHCTSVTHTHTRPDSQTTRCMSRSEHTIIITITIFSLLIRTNFNNYVCDHLNY